MSSARASDREPQEGDIVEPSEEFLSKHESLQRVEAWKVLEISDEGTYIQPEDDRVVSGAYFEVERDSLTVVETFEEGT